MRSRIILKLKFAGYQLLEYAPEAHLQKVNNAVIKICLYSFLTEIVFAVHQTFEDLTQAATEKQMERLHKQIKIFGADTPSLFKDMHCALSVFDKNQNIALHDLQADYSDKIIFSK